MNPLRALLAIVLLLSLAPVRAAEIELADALELRARDGLPNALRKLAAGGEVRIAYIGGSITAAEGWRPMTTRWLAGRYPQARIVEINAAIGGTGSDLGVFRFRQDVLRHRPDLVFIEFAVNDGGAPVDQIHKCMEGMVRQAWAADPSIDICFVYTLVDGFVPTLAGGKFPRAASAMEQVADHYGIPTIHMGLEVVRLAGEGKLVMKASPAEREKLKDKIVFSSDGVHPHAETGHRLYLEAIVRSWEKLIGVGTPGPRALGQPFVAGHYQAAKLVPLSSARMGPGWQQAPADQSPARGFAKFLPQLWMAKEPGTELSFAFKGTYAGIYDLLGPDCGQLQVSVDGGQPKSVLRFDSYCTYHRMGSFVAARDLPDGRHTVTIRVDSTLPDKKAILAKRNEVIDNPKRYEGTTWYAGWIMVIGELEGQ